MTSQSDPDLISFDEAANNAEVELRARIRKLTPEQQEVIIEIHNWWEKWYETAGHKRLGRIIMKV